MRPGEIPAAGLHAIAGVFLPLLIPLSWSGRPGEGVTYAEGVFQDRSWKGAAWL